MFIITYKNTSLNSNMYSLCSVLSVLLQVLQSILFLFCIVYYKYLGVSLCYSTGSYGAESYSAGDYNACILYLWL